MSGWKANLFVQHLSTTRQFEVLYIRWKGKAHSQEVIQKDKVRTEDNTSQQKTQTKDKVPSLI